METIDPRDMPLYIHVIPRNGKWRVRWSKGKRALRIFADKKEAIEFAKNKAGGEYSVLVQLLNGFVDVEESILVKKS